MNVLKILYVTTIGLTMRFFTSFLEDLLKEGHTVDIATNAQAHPVPECYNRWGCKIYQISTSRSPFSPGNIKSVGEIKKLVAEGGYDIVHCHTPIAAACTRLACKDLRKKGVKVIYTAHGFHFYTGAPVLNWLIFYPIEKLCARWTDILLTMNQEDYHRAKAKLSAKRIEYVPGVGIDAQRFSKVQIDRNGKRAELGIPEDAFLLCSVGELNANKNHEVIIRALAQLNQKNVHYMIAGVGDKEAELLELARQLHLADRVHLLGYRNDVPELYKAADLFVFPSFREGLPVSVMEAMAAGKAVVCSNARGNGDLVCEGEGGFIVHNQDVQQYAQKINTLLSDRQLCLQMGQFNARYIEGFTYAKVHEVMKKIYHG